MPPAVATISGFLIPDGDSFPKTTAAGAHKMRMARRAVATVSGFLIPDGDSFPKTTAAGAPHKMMAARTVESESGFIIPNGDSFPTTTASHSSVTPPHNVETGLIPSASIADASASTTSGVPAAGTSVVPSSSSAFTSHTTAPVASQQPVSQGYSELIPRSAVIAILVLSALALLAGLFFLVRFYYVRRRASKTTLARARASQVVVISDPVNFQHVSSADGNPPLWKNTSDKVSMVLGTAQVESHGQEHGQDVGARMETDVEKVQNVQFARNPRQDSF